MLARSGLIIDIDIVNVIIVVLVKLMRTISIVIIIVNTVVDFMLINGVNIVVFKIGARFERIRFGNLNHFRFDFKLYRSVCSFVGRFFNNSVGLGLRTTVLSIGFDALRPKRNRIVQHLPAMRAQHSGQTIERADLCKVNSWELETLLGFGKPLRESNTQRYIH